MAFLRHVRMRQSTHVPSRRISHAAIGLFLTMALLLCVMLQTNVTQAQTPNRILYVAMEPDIGGPGFDAFSPQTIFAQQGDVVNLTVRNVGNNSFHLVIDGYVSSTLIQLGVINSSSSTFNPTDTSVLFTASSPGIFNFYSAENPELSGQLIVLPSSWSSYNPATRDRNLSQIVIPDFAGDGYDKFFSGVMVANQGDNISISIVNTDTSPHGFSMPAYGIDDAVNPGQALTNGSTAPLTTSIPTFTASEPGIFEFLCTVYCGPGHSQMVGYLVVLPKGNSSYTPTPEAAYRYLTVKPDFAGDGYDKFLPGTIVVNQNDLVCIQVRNTDDMTHGFDLTTFGINDIIAPGTDLPDSSVQPNDTYITPFSATQPGIYDFFCTVYCGPGHSQMVGQLVVLPSLSGSSSPPSTVPTSPVSTNMGLILVAVLGALFMGVAIGLIINVRGRKPGKIDRVEGTS